MKYENLSFRWRGFPDRNDMDNKIYFLMHQILIFYPTLYIKQQQIQLIMQTEQVQSNHPHTPTTFTFDQRKPFFPVLDPYHHYLEAYGASFHLHQQMDQLRFYKDRLLKKVQRLEEEFQKLGDKKIDQPKRQRRLAENITKIYQCEHERCERTYGTLGSLLQHQRLKHSQLIQKMPFGTISSL